MIILNTKTTIFLICTVIVVAVSIVFFCCVTTGRATHPKKGALNINGVLIASDKIEIYSNHAKIPLIEALACYGFSIQWVSEETAVLTHENKTLSLSLSEKALIDLDSGDNLLIMAPGSQFFYCDVSGRDIVVDTVTFQNALRFLGFNVAMSVNYEQAVIYFSTSP